MTHDSIDEVEIDVGGHLRIRPELATFPYICREAMEVSWDQEDNALYSPVPKEWTYPRWFEQSLASVAQQGCELHLKPGTKYSKRNSEKCAG